MKTQLKIKNGEKVFFVSDTHIGHKNIIRGISKWENGIRDFNTLEEHDEFIIDLINSNIGPNDTLFFLGDFCLGRTKDIISALNKIKCRNIYLIYGNHDDRIEAKPWLFSNYFISMKYFMNIKIEDQLVSLCHFPLHRWNESHNGAFNIHGHEHNDMPLFCNEDGLLYRQLDVSIEYNQRKEYKIWPWPEIKEKLLSEKYINTKHH